MGLFEVSGSHLFDPGPPSAPMVLMEVEAEAGLKSQGIRVEWTTAALPFVRPPRSEADMVPGPLLALSFLVDKSQPLTSKATVLSAVKPTSGSYWIFRPSK